MRFLRILPAVWAMISCPFSSFTRKVALGRSSLTVHGNSRSSSFVIRPLCFAAAGECTEPTEKQGDPRVLDKKARRRGRGVSAVDAEKEKHSRRHGAQVFLAAAWRILPVTKNRRSAARCGASVRRARSDRRR